MPSHEHNITISSAGNHKHGIYSNYNEEGSNGVADAYRSTANGVYTENAGDHTHTANIKNTGSDMPPNNMQPYVAVFMWKRTA
ncbi:phage baseplate protein [Phascolarctobacterium faecium]|uniref:phage baseplate protein n=1 Tax=Phascolarctobacterium faecium TaxID=33025 RepID=UPI0035220025